LPEEDVQENDDLTVNAPDDSDVTPSDSDGADEKFISQKELDRILQKRLKRQEDQFKKQFGDYDILKADAEKFRELQDEKATDSERWEREKAQLLTAVQERDEKLNKLERAALITDLATEKGLPKSFWKRVSGDSPEEIEEDIDQIISDLGVTKDDSKEKTPTKKPAKRVYGGGGESESPDPDIASIVSKIPRGPQLHVEKPRSYK
jgi:hypothetical protein